MKGASLPSKRIHKEHETMPGLNDFKANFLGGARPSLYRVIHPFPLAAAGPDATLKMSYLCKGIQLPGINVAPIDVFYMGRPLKLAGDRTFDELTFTIINDNDFAIRNAYERWANLINQHQQNRGTLLPEDYQIDITIEQLDRNEETLKTYTLIGAFPTNISPIEMGWDQVDTIEEFTVSLAYQWWEDPLNGIV